MRVVERRDVDNEFGYTNSLVEHVLAVAGHVPAPVDNRAR
jgi:hypothetical protein